jgi:xylan 1,4-beta-xylosidase
LTTLKKLAFQCFAVNYIILEKGGKGIMNQKLSAKLHAKKLGIVSLITLFVLSFLIITIYTNEVRRSTSEITNFNTYRNSFHLDKEWDFYGIGDPYVLRFNGRYYLYCSTKDYEKGVKVWSSENLVDWNYEGKVTEEEKTKGARGPEVIYWNGYFYMYASSRGEGHYVLRSEKPTGPFTLETDNLRLSIDGSVFIDDDGKFYFTHAGNQGIVGHEMKDPLNIDFSSKTLNAYLQGWTEGSMIMKRNGLYYLTYTGNHVFSKGSRISYSIAQDSPIGNYVLPENNPIIINTEEPFNGLGNSSTVMGPDLDSYYIVYHNLIGRSIEGLPVRQMNIDRIVFNGQKLSVLGPTYFNQPVPKRADFYTWMAAIDPQNNYIKNIKDNDNYILVDKNTDANYTAEYNFYIKDVSKINENSKIGAIFSYKSENDFMHVSVNLMNKTLDLYEVKNESNHIIASAELPKDFNFSKLHSIKIDKCNNSLKVYFDNMLKISNNVSDTRGGKIGYIYSYVEPIFEYTAFNNDVSGSSDYETVKPVPGRIEAVQFLKGKERGYHSNSKEKAVDSYRYDSEIKTNLSSDKSYSVKLNKGEWLSYNINVQEDSNYGLDFMVKKQKENLSVEIYIDDIKIDAYKAAAEGSPDENEWAKIRIGELKLKSGFHNFKIKLVNGSMEFKWMDFYKLSSIEENSLFGWSYYDNSRAFDGNDNWGDYVLEMDVKINDEATSNNPGILFRVTNVSNFQQIVQGSFMGYRIRLEKAKVILEKVNYGTNIIKTADISFNASRYKHVKVIADKALIKIYIDDMNKPIIEYIDDNAFMYGKIGIEAFEPFLSFKNVTIKPVK